MPRALTLDEFEWEASYELAADPNYTGGVANPVIVGTRVVRRASRATSAPRFLPVVSLPRHRPFARAHLARPNTGARRRRRVSSRGSPTRLGDDPSPLRDVAPPWAEVAA